MEFGMRPHRVNCALNAPFESRAYRSHGFSCPGKLENGIDEVGQLVHSDPNLFVDFAALCVGEIRFAQEFCIGNHRGERMPKIVRDRCRHLSYGREPLSLQQSPLSELESLAHTIA